MAENNKIVKVKSPTTRKIFNTIAQIGEVLSYPTMLVSKLKEVSGCIFQICVAHSIETLPIAGANV